MEEKFKSKEELFAHLKANKDLLISKKKSEMKKADTVMFGVSFVGKGEATKATNSDVDSITVKAVINTTNVMDSHSDVHIPGIWSKSLKENKNIYLLKEHQMSFENVISDNIKATAETMSWKDLGFNFKGETQALIFEAVITKADNSVMFDKYINGKVKNHSVGMQYVKIFLAVNSEDDEYKEEKANWDKYIPFVVNKETAEDQGYFWAVTEAKFFEGSAVLVGSNQMTPTLSIEPSEDTQKNEPLEGTQKSINIYDLI